MDKLLGESAALATAICWTITALAFESAGKKVGSLSVNLNRLIFAFFIIGVFSYFRKGLFFASDASLEAWIWLPISGLIGFVIGDLLLFEAFVLIGARISMLIMSLTPPIAAFFGWIIIKEELSAANFLGMTITILGISIVILAKESRQKKISSKRSFIGFWGSYRTSLRSGIFETGHEGLRSFSCHPD